MRIAIANQKGGTAKTTTAVNLAAALSRCNHRVLLVDLDPQANATAVFLSAEFTLGPAESAITSYEVLVEKTPIEKAIQAVTLSENERYGYSEATLYLLPSHIRLAKAELELISAMRREDRLAYALSKSQEKYDFIIIDCPPSLSMLTLNALMAAEKVIIPVEPGYFPIIGISLITDTIDDVSEINGLSLLGVLPTLQDNTVVSRETVEVLHQMFDEKVLPAIPRRVAVREAAGSGEDIFSYDGGNDAAVAYMALAHSIKKQNG